MQSPVGSDTEIDFDGNRSDQEFNAREMSNFLRPVTPELSPDLGNQAPNEQQFVPLQNNIQPDIANVRDELLSPTSRKRRQTEAQRLQLGDGWNPDKMGFKRR